MMEPKRIAVGMSGGVDSTATAYLLKKQGHHVFGVTMIVHDLDHEFVDDAKHMCHLLGIEHHIVDLKQDFKTYVENEFISEYKKGRTPNPCVICNKTIKYGLFMDAALHLGGDYFATGHYARIVYDEGEQRYKLLRGVTQRKDQSYVLFGLTQDRLKKMILPLGNFESKDEIRKIANEVSHYMSKKKDSDGICFIQGGDHKRFLDSKIGMKTLNGKFIDMEGNILGSHDGIHCYTIGQKRKLGSGLDNKFTVIKINADDLTILLGEEKDCYRQNLIAERVNWISGKQPDDRTVVTVRICQWGYDLKATIKSTHDDQVLVDFIEPVRAISPGQACVFYQGEEILGGGIIY